jgi:hypothetical protein
MSNEIKEDVGKYIELKLKSTGVSPTLKAEITAELSQYVEKKVSEEMLPINHKMKKLQGDLCSTVEKIASRFNNEAILANDVRSRLVYLEQTQGNFSNLHPPSGCKRR